MRDNVIIAWAKDFRSFWGDKSELRRFQDGSINEAVLFPCINMEEKKMVCKRIIQHLLNLHCHIPASSILYQADELNFVFKPNRIHEKVDTKKQKYRPGCGEEESLHFIKTFDELCKQIRNLKDLPLKINSIHGIDPAFRMTQVFAPRQYNQKADTNKEIHFPKYGKKCPAWCPVYNALIQFETSGKWPDNLTAIQHIKAAFHIKIANGLRQQLHLTTRPTPTFVDISKNGFVFRISVVHYREMVLHQESPETGFLKHEHEISGRALETQIVKKPVHNTLIHSMNSRFHAYALTTRLCKRWIAAHMLSSYLCDEVIELINAYLFLAPGQNQTPSSHLSGFLRFLNCLSKFDWQGEAMIVNLNEQITDEERIEIEENFALNRSQLPPVFISTPYDKHTSRWTKEYPTTQIIHRIRLLAGAALTVVDSCSFSLNKDTVKHLFRPTLSDYDVVIELDKEQIPTYHQSIDSSAAVKLTVMKDSVTSSCLPVVDFNPASMFVEELRSAYHDIALFFYDPYGGINVGVVWKSKTQEVQPFKVLHAQYKKLVEEKKTKKKKKEKLDVLSNSTKNMTVNLEAILSDFKIIGKELVVDVKEK